MSRAIKIHIQTPLVSPPVEHVAQAITEALKADLKIIIYGSRVGIIGTGDEETGVARLPWPVIAWLEAVKAGAEPQPFSFELVVPTHVTKEEGGHYDEQQQSL